MTYIVTEYIIIMCCVIIMCMMLYGLSISHTLSVYYYYYVCYFFLVIVTLTFGGFLQIAEIGGGHLWNPDRKSLGSVEMTVSFTVGPGHKQTVFNSLTKCP